MDVRYGELPLDLLRALFGFEELLKLFLDLVTRLGGDVAEALDVMRRLLSGFRPPDTGSAPPRQP